MISAVIKGPTCEEASKQVAKAHEADLLELRLDLFNDLTKLKAFRDSCSLPVIFTLRSQKQGGGWLLGEEERLAALLSLGELSPDYMDVEADAPAPFLTHLQERFPQIKIILSYHDYAKTPEDLEALYATMRTKKAHLYKIAVQAQGSLDALALLAFAQGKSDLIAVSMGPYGMVSRILAPIFERPFMYAALEEGEAIPSLSHLLECYHYKRLHPGTQIYGLIGDPVDGSVSDRSHNAFFRKKGIDAIYVKIPLKTQELAPFLSLARKLNFQGLSVTMPLKEAIIPYLKAASSDSINTLIAVEGGYEGISTDGIGALDAIEEILPVRGVKCTLLGYGGAAKAIAWEAHKRGAKIAVTGRSQEKAQALASQFQGDTCIKNSQVLINCTPLPMPISLEELSSEMLVMDTKTKPKNTPFLLSAAKKGCAVVYGYQMFVNQAYFQFLHWFPAKISIEDKEVLMSDVLRIVKD